MQEQQRQLPKSRTIFGVVVFGLPATIKYGELLALANEGAPGVDDIDIEIDDRLRTTCTIEYDNEHSLRLAVTRLHNRIYRGIVLSCYSNMHVVRATPENDDSDPMDVDSPTEQRKDNEAGMRALAAAANLAWHTDIEPAAPLDEDTLTATAAAAEAAAAETSLKQPHIQHRRCDTIESMHDFSRNAFGERGFQTITSAVSDGFKREGIQRFASRQQYIDLWDEAMSWLFSAGRINYAFQDDPDSKDDGDTEIDEEHEDK